MFKKLKLLNYTIEGSQRGNSNKSKKKKKEKKSLDLRLEFKLITMARHPFPVQLWFMPVA